jgi:hypothetical protein
VRFNPRITIEQCEDFRGAVNVLLKVASKDPSAKPADERAALETVQKFRKELFLRAGQRGGDPVAKLLSSIRSQSRERVEQSIGEIREVIFSIPGAGSVYRAVDTAYLLQTSKELLAENAQVAARVDATLGRTSRLTAPVTPPIPTANVVPLAPKQVRGVTAEDFYSESEESKQAIDAMVTEYMSTLGLTDPRARRTFREKLARSVGVDPTFTTDPEAA